MSTRGSRVPIESGRAVRPGVESRHSSGPVRPTSVSTCTFAKRRAAAAGVVVLAAEGDQFRRVRRVLSRETTLKRSVRQPNGMAICYVLRQLGFGFLSNNGTAFERLEKLEKHGYVYTNYSYTRIRVH